jgi:catechol 2,3-dioxygenase-like lactoylglutathione lyase family enzyme
MSLGEFRWLTVVGANEPDGVELLLEPDAHPAAKTFKQALVADGIPYTSFTVDDVAATHADLESRGVRFTQAPTAMGPVVTAVLDDTCGNLIQLTSPA